MDYHLLTKKCDGMCDSCECAPSSEPHLSCKTPAGCRENGCLGWCDEHRPDPALKPDIDALTKLLAEDPAFAAQVTGAEFECLGEPSLCKNPRGCACPETERD